MYCALQALEALEMDIDCFEEPIDTKKLVKAVAEFDNYIVANQRLIPNYGDRYRYGERISTGFVESAINQVVSKRFVKKQQMRWTQRGAHLLLQIRTKELSNELHEIFHRWYPGMKLSPVQAQPAA